MKNILFVCTGNSARSIIAESLVNNRYNDKFKAYSAGSNPSGEINKDIKHFLNNKGFNLQNYSSKNFNVFVNGEIKIDHVITVCNNANNEVCPIWPKENQIIHWDIEDPVTKLNDASEDKKFKIITDTFNNIDKRIKNWILLKNTNKIFLGEFIGSSFLVMVIVGSGIMAENLTNDNALRLTANTLATGAGLFVLITAFANISGAHFNPFVSLAMFLRKKSMENFSSYIFLPKYLVVC